MDRRQSEIYKKLKTVQICMCNNIFKNLARSHPVVFNPLAPEFSLKFEHILYLKCEYYRNKKR